MTVHRIADRLTCRMQRLDLLISRRVPSRAITWGAIGVSVVAGIVLTLGGLLHRPVLWLALPSLVLIRLALGAVPRPALRRTEWLRRAIGGDGVESFVEVPEPAPIEDEMLHAVGR